MNNTNQIQKEVFILMGNNGKLLDWKMRILDSGLLKRQNDQECICYCPWCGERKGKCYIKMILDDDTPMLYHCFICQESGVVNSTFLDKLGIDNFHDGDVNELDQIIRGNSSGYRKQIKSSNGDVECNLKEYLINDGYDNNIAEYMKKRFDIKSIDTNKMLEWCVVSNIKKYLIDIGYKQVTDPHIILNNRIWFRMRNGSAVGRLISGKGERWMVISNKREHEKNIYVIGNLFNLSGRVIRVWMGEGVMDVIGMQNKLEQSVDESDFAEMNDVFIAVMGRMYSSGFEWLIGRGLFGESVEVNIICDDDYTNIEKQIKKYRKCFYKIKVFKNMIDKDCGVAPENIELGIVS